MRVAIHGIGIVGAFGSGIDAFSGALTRNERRTQKVALQSPAGQREVKIYRADTARLDEFIPKGSLRRVDHFARMGILASSLALKDAEKTKVSRSRLGVVVATGYGASATTSAFLDSFINEGDHSSSPTHFSNSVHNAAAAHISIFLKLTGPCLTVSQFGLSFPSALLTAMAWLEEGRADSVLLGSVDEWSDILGYCWWRFFGDWSGGQVEPFDLQKQSAIPGEGAAFFLVSLPERHGGAYCEIVDVQTGYVEGERPSLSGHGLLILGADGHRECGKKYAELLQFPGRSSPAASFTPAYGSFPTNHAFDMAAGALILGGNRTFVSSYGPPEDASLGSRHSLPGGGSDVVECLKIGMENEFGLITLAR